MTDKRPKTLLQIFNLPEGWYKNNLKISENEENSPEDAIDLIRRGFLINVLVNFGRFTKDGFEFEEDIVLDIIELYSENDIINFFDKYAFHIKEYTKDIFDALLKKKYFSTIMKLLESFKLDLKSSGQNFSLSTAFSMSFLEYDYDNFRKNINKIPLDEGIIRIMLEREKDKGLFCKYPNLFESINFSKEDIELIIKNGSIDERSLYHFVHNNSSRVEGLPEVLVERFIKNNLIEFLLDNEFITPSKGLFLRLITLETCGIGHLIRYLPRFEGYLDDEVAAALIENGHSRFVSTNKDYFTGLDNLEIVEFGLKKR